MPTNNSQAASGPRHLRRMRAVYTERLEVLRDAARRWCSGALTLRTTRTGLHAVADLDGEVGVFAAFYAFQEIVVFAGGVGVEVGFVGADFGFEDFRGTGL